MGTGQATDPPNDSTLDLIALYLREIAREPLLTHEQEIALATIVRSGHEAQAQLAATHNDTHLTEVQIAELERQVAAAQVARERFTQGNVRLVISIARQYREYGLSFLDLIQEGNLGLMRAIEKYDPTLINAATGKPYKFSTYAIWWIRQAMTRGLASQVRTIRLPIYMTEQIGKLFRVSQALEGHLHREPTYEEMAAEMGVSPDQIAALLVQAQEIVSLDIPLAGENATELGELIADEDNPAVVDEVSTRLLQETIDEALASLTPRESKVLRLRFGLAPYETAHTLEEIGNVIGLTRERIRQIEGQALRRLQKRAGHRLVDYHK
jgi:RNA polymerase primary sigma factor